MRRTRNSDEQALVDFYNPHQRHADRVRMLYDDYEEDENEKDDTLDPAFSSHEQVNGMFYTK
jgi:hypothetical protein